MTAKALRLILPFDLWPAADRAAWQAALEPGDAFTTPGLAAGWTEKTRKQVRKDHGLWLGHLQRRRSRRLDVPAGDRLTLDAMRSFVEELQARVSPVTVLSRMIGLSESYRVMWPDVDRRVLLDLISRLRQRAVPSRRKQTRVLSSRDLLHGALKHFDRVLSGTAPSQTIRASRVRNALMVAMLAVHPVRLANFTAIRIGQHLDLSGGHYWLRFAAHETKERQPFETPFATILQEPLDTYLQRVRPILLDGRRNDALWISVRKTAISDQGVYDQIVKTTERIFGRPINPHLFRDCAMTTLATEDPAHIMAGSRVLGHSSLRTGEKHYNQAQMLSAAVKHHAVLADLRGTEQPTPEIPT